MDSWGRFEARGRWVSGAETLRARLAAQSLDSLARLSSRCLGEMVSDSRSSWVRRLRIGATELYIKTYDYPSWRDRIRGLGRNSFLAPSRPRREARALAWLREHGFGGPKALGVLEARVLGFLRRAVLLTEAYPGRPLSTLLPELPGPERASVLRELQQFLIRLHAAGFRDRNMDLRNLLARKAEGEKGGRQEEGEAEWKIVKIDSPRYRLLAPGRQGDRLARADWQRLRASLAELDLPLPPPGESSHPSQAED